MSCKTYYEWLGEATRHGMAALMPKAAGHRDAQRDERDRGQHGPRDRAVATRPRCRPVRRPARSARRSASGVQKVLRCHQLGTRRERLAALASLTAAGTGQLTDAALRGPFGLCLAATDPRPSRVPGHLLRRQARRRRPGRGSPTLVRPRRAYCRTMAPSSPAVPSPTTPHNSASLTRSRCAAQTTTACANASRDPCCRNPAGHSSATARVNRVAADLEAAVQTWAGDSNTRRRSHGDYMRGPSPRQVLDQLKARRAA